MNDNLFLKKAAALCSRAEYCASQIEEKLRRWGADEEETARIIAKLIDEKYIDNERYCRAFANDKFRYANWGRMKIRQALRLQGLPAQSISEALQEIDEEEYLQVLRKILDAKARSLHDTDPYVRRAKLARHAAGKGFELELILSLLPE